jgi:hypothetical protein
MNPRMTHHHPHLSIIFFLSLSYSLSARARASQISLSLSHSLSHEKKISLKKRYSRSVSKYVRVCVFFVSLGKRSGCITPLTVGTPLEKLLLKAPEFNFQMTKCFPTRGDRHQNTSFYFFLATTTRKTKLSLSLFERYFFCVSFRSRHT